MIIFYLGISYYILSVINYLVELGKVSLRISKEFAKKQKKVYPIIYYCFFLNTKFALNFFTDLNILCD